MAKKKKKKSGLGKIVKWAVAVVILVFIYGAYILFVPNFSPKTDGKTYLYVPNNSSLEEVTRLLGEKAEVHNMISFRQVATLLHYGPRVHSGRYEIKAGMNNLSLVRALRSGRQTPVKLTFNNIRTKEQLAARLSMQLMADSVSILKLLNDTAFLSH